MPTISTQKTRWVVAVLAAVAVSSGAWLPDAWAAFQLRLDSGGSGVVVTDNAPGDTVGAAGELEIAPTTIGLFTANTTQGTSQTGVLPILHELDLHSTITATGAGTVNVFLANTGFNGTTGPLAMTSAFNVTFSAPTGSSITLNSHVNPQNLVQDFGADHATVSVLSAVSGPPAGSFTAVGSGGFTFTSTGAPSENFNHTASTTFMASGSYSLFSAVSVNFTGAGTVSFGDNQSTTAVPVPGTIVLLAAGLAAAAGQRVVARRRSRSRG